MIMLALLVIVTIAFGIDFHWLDYFNVEFDLGRINAQGGGIAEPSPKVDVIWIGSFPECQAEGAQDVKSYTSVGVEQSNAQCTLEGSVTTFWTLIANKANGEKAIINVAGLADSRNRDGGTTLIDLGDFLRFSFFLN